jgi:Protein of unknown function (DUF1501)
MRNEDHCCRAGFQPGRRALLRGAAVSGLSLLWADWQRAMSAGQSSKGTARSVILIFNAGAPSHIDLFDPKPDAPDNVRGPFQTVATSAPGVRVTELLPQLARQAHRLAIVRSVQHAHTQHNAGMYWSIVGRPYRIDSTLINPSRADIPSFGTLIGWLARRDGYTGAMPPYVITPAPHCDSTAYVTPGQYGGCLGAEFDPLVLNANPNAARFEVPGLGMSGGLTPERIGSRRELQAKLDSEMGWKQPARFREFAVNGDKAYTLVTSPDVRRAFDLSQEHPRVRDRYGRTSWGQSHLLARRLVEAGVRFVTTVNGPSIVWDTHKDNFRSLKNKLVPPMEQGFAALLEDLEVRGLLASTLVIWMGDFGRTPVINTDAGRDHWPHCYSLVLAGGGVRGGQVIGESDRRGALPRSAPIAPADLHASVFSALGYDPQRVTYQSPEGRPYPLSEGKVIHRLFA